MMLTRFAILCTLFLNAVYGANTAWVTPANNELPLGSAAGTSPYTFMPAVDFPSANQTVQVWLEAGAGRLYYTYYNGTTWIAPSNNELPLGLSTGIYGMLPPVYNPHTGTLIIIWQSVANGPLFYATYDGTSWTAPSNNQLPLGAAGTVLSYNPPIATDQFMLIWEAVLNGPLFYATYDGTTWTAPADNEIPLGDSGPLRFFYNPCYNAETNQVMQIWQETALTHIYYSVFDGGNWSPGQALPLGLSTAVEYGAFTFPMVYPPTNKIIEIWQDSNDGRLYYSLFNGTHWVTPVNNELPLGSSSGVLFYAYPVYDAFSEQIVIPWQDSVDNLIYYARFHGSHWEAPADNVIPLGSSTEFYGFNNPTYDPFTHQVVFTWEESAADQFFYAVYNGSIWTAPTNNTVPMGLSNQTTVFRDMVFDTGSGKLLQIWQDFSNDFRLFYSAYTAFAPSPPLSFTGSKTKEKFLTQTDLINLLSWTPSVDPNVVGYVVRRGEAQIFSGKGLNFADHNRKKNTPYTYSLTAKDDIGLESTPLTLTIE